MNEEQTERDWLDELLTIEMHAVARKAQIDYFAVNSPNGIRSGEDPNLLADFLQTDIDSLKQALLAWHSQGVVEDACNCGHDLEHPYPRHKVGVGPYCGRVRPSAQGDEPANDIYKMSLHESLYADCDTSNKIVRVPGGWIYIFYLDSDRAESQFVPFSNEYQRLRTLSKDDIDDHPN
jgi:hypothetical protein